MKRTTADGTVKLLLCHAPYDGIKPAVFLQLGPKSPQVRAAFTHQAVLNRRWHGLHLNDNHVSK